MSFLQADVDSRIKLFIDLEDPTITTDLRALNSSSERTKYDRFWEECDAVLMKRLIQQLMIDVTVRSLT